MKDYLDLWTEDEKTLWMDVGFTTSIGFITTEDGWGINKKYLAEKYRWRLIHALEDFDPHTEIVIVERIQDIRDRVEKKVRKEFKKELKGFKLLDQTSNKKDVLWNSLTADYFKYVLNGELLDMVWKTESVLDEHYEKLRRKTIKLENLMRSIINTLANIDRETKDIAYVEEEEEE